jgi:hypothetical protein
MKKQNIKFTAILFGLVFALALSAQAGATLDGGPNHQAVNDAATNPGLPMFTIHSTGDVTRGKTGSFVIAKSLATAGGAGQAAAGLSGTYIKFSVSGTAVEGVDYVATVSPAYVGPSGYAVISIKALADPRGAFNKNAYSVIITLEDAPGYSVLEPSSAKMLIKPSQAVNN